MLNIAHHQTGPVFTEKRLVNHFSIIDRREAGNPPATALLLRAATASAPPQPDQAELQRLCHNQPPAPTAPPCPTDARFNRVAHPARVPAASRPPAWRPTPRVSGRAGQGKARFMVTSGWSLPKHSASRNTASAMERPAATRRWRRPSSRGRRHREPEPRPSGPSGADQASSRRGGGNHGAAP